MSPNALPQSSDSTLHDFSVPGKVFLLGEYAVLSGQLAIVATLAPRFTLRMIRGPQPGHPDQGASRRPGAVTAHFAFHPQSPGGRLIRRAAERQVAIPDFRFMDPFGGQGGFGASTAQFALVYGALASVAGWEPRAEVARQVYRELMADAVLLPSGADLVAQWSGGVVGFEASRGLITPQFGAVDWRGLLIFSAAGQIGRKVPTHEHLNRLSAKGGLTAALVTELTEVLAQAWPLQGIAFLGNAMDRYAKVLARHGLELDAARGDREFLRALPGVLGVKGTGALLADAVVVAMDPASVHFERDRAQVLGLAEARGLRLVANGLGSEAQAGFRRDA